MLDARPLLSLHLMPLTATARSPAPYADDHSAALTVRTGGKWSMKVMDYLMSVEFSERLININLQVNAGCAGFFFLELTFQALN